MREEMAGPWGPLLAIAKILGWVLLVVVTAGQLMAWTPPGWWVPALQWGPSQYAIIAVGIVRDALGAWIVLAALLTIGLLVLAGPRRGWATLRRPTVALATASLVSAVALTSWQVLDARSEGVDVVVAPTLPFTNDLVPADREVTVGTVDDTDLKADLYLPEDPAPEGAPVVVRVHGGGFDSGSKAPSPYFVPLLERGYAVLDVTYRLASGERQTWDTAVADVGCALTWIGATGSEAGLDPTRVGMMGESAGGQLVVNAGNMAAAGTLDPSCRSQGELPEVQAVVAGYPAVDGSAAYGQSALGSALGDRYVGGPPEELPERYELTDSANHLGPSGPPLLIYQGAADHLILPGPVRDLARASSRAGTTTRYVELPGLEHTTGGGLGTLSFGDLVGRDLATQWYLEHL
ncbi:alpha/beta hydrolase fold domain-containing protein [Aeromicrobium sp. CF4.19]|uniref:alpha/beta hydrolase family protein n=1 Tax=Aeromicrobium sp. CF4.19 TaxID=3373082 RepID=UPI003EE48D10